MQIEWTKGEIPKRQLHRKRSRIVSSYFTPEEYANLIRLKTTMGGPTLSDVVRTAVTHLAARYGKQI